MFIVDKLPSRVSLNSNFIVELDEVVDKNGTPVNIYTTAFKFQFYSRTGGGVYNIVWVPGDDNADVCKHCYVENNKLYLVFEDYKFQVGMLMVKVGIIVSNKHFRDDVWDWWYNEQPSGIEMTY